jgi:hypothetical protein
MSDERQKLIDEVMAWGEKFKAKLAELATTYNDIKRFVEGAKEVQIRVSAQMRDGEEHPKSV